MGKASDRKEPGADVSVAPTGSGVNPFESVQLLTYEQAGQRLGGLSAKTVERMVNAGVLPYVQVLSRKRIALEDIQEYIDAHRCRVEPEDLSDNVSKLPRPHLK